MSLCPPRRNDSALISRNIGINDRDLEAVNNANGVYADLAIIKPVVHLLKRGALEDPGSVFECNAVTGSVPPILRQTPGVRHCVIFTLCIYAMKCARGPATGPLLPPHNLFGKKNGARGSPPRPARDGSTGARDTSRAFCVEVWPPTVRVKVYSPGSAAPAWPLSGHTTSFIPARAGGIKTQTAFPLASEIVTEGRVPSPASATHGAPPNPPRPPPPRPPCGAAFAFAAPTGAVFR